jgi:lipopolysaccharide transport system ATP-binding protein
MPDIVLSVRGISKKYMRGPDHSSSARQIIGKAIFWPYRKIMGRPTSVSSTHKRDDFWALKDISFDLQRGERLGIIGRNGAGKSTLLKILSRIVYPSEGEASIHGRLTSLLEVGTGFNMSLTGRENIYLNASIYGLGQKEINSKLEEIVEFSGVGDFLDTPVRHYSSGMYMRLAFSVAAHLDPDILFLDEVLAVGDIAFQEKCLGKVNQLASSGLRTIVYVSHNLGSVGSLCTKVLWLDKGRVRLLGDPENVISAYYKEVATRVGGSLEGRYDRTGTGELRYTNIWYADRNNQLSNTFRSGETIRIVLEYEFKVPFQNPKDVLVCIVFVNDREQRLFGCPSDVLRVDLTKLQPKGSFVCVIPDLPLLPGTYQIHVSCLINRRLADKVTHAAQVTILEGNFYGTGRLPHQIYGDILMKHEWYLSGVIGDKERQLLNSSSEVQAASDKPT